MILSIFKQDLPVFEALRKGIPAEALSLYLSGEASYYENRYGISLATIMPFLGLIKETESIPVIRKGETVQSFLTPLEFEKHFNVIFRSKPRFERYTDLEAAIKLSDKLLKKRYLERFNDWTKALIEKQVRLSRLTQAAIKFIDKELGYGVFATSDIPQYTFVGEYSGIIRRRTARKDQFNNYIFGYTAASNATRYVIDAKHEGNLTRFINHSFEPNLISRWITIDGITRIVFVTKRGIKKGEQLSYDYGNDYWRTRREPKLL